MNKGGTALKKVVFKGTEFSSEKGDLTQFKADAIVNPANSRGEMGGGVAGALKRAGGARIEEDAMAAAPIKIGCAVATSAGALNARFVIHAPTMSLPAQKTNAKAVDLAVAAALSKAAELGVESIAFPGMGTGVGGVSAREATNTMVAAAKFFVSRKKSGLKKIFFVAFDDELEKAFDAAMERLLR
ncbi:MAG: macro domain-containing protein [Candidatus Micrarchaeia archaeon]